jgi:hypothetical protein
VRIVRRIESPLKWSCNWERIESLLAPPAHGLKAHTRCNWERIERLPRELGHLAQSILNAATGKELKENERLRGENRQLLERVAEAATGKELKAARLGSLTARDAAKRLQLGKN